MPEAPRNILYIMLDDADYYDFGYNNTLLDAPDAITPHIDGLRSNGAAFTQFYSAAPVCTPTRISVLTGDSPLEVGAVHVWPQHYSIQQGTAGVNGLSTEVPQLGLLMKDEGFVTGHFGKWHVGSSRPEYRHEALGFDTFSRHQRLPETEDWSGPFRIITEDGTRTEDTDYVDNVHTDELISFIEESIGSGEQFFANFWPLTPHTPIALPRDFDNSQTNFDLATDRGKLLAMMYTMDQNIGRIITTLSDLDALDDTLIVLTSDNGGLDRVRNETAPWNLGKAYLYESGIHVPMVAHWPDAIEAGAANDTVMTTTDLLPTFLDLIGDDPSALYATIDGRSKADAFTTNAEIAHDPIVWQAKGGKPFTDDPRADRTFALRYDDLKIIKPQGRNDLTDSNAYRVYDLIANPEETTNLNVASREDEFGERLELLLLEARLAASRIELLPETISGQLNLPFDPRFDIGSKDLTLDFSVTVPETISTNKNLFTLDGAHSAQLLANSSIQWTIIGADASRQPVTQTLSSDALTPGVHRITLGIYGHKNEAPLIDLHVDGVPVDQVEFSPTNGEILGLWSSGGDITIGDNGISMTDVKYYSLHFYQDELNRLEEPLPIHLFGKAGADTIVGSAANEAILGGRGNDALKGDDGNDQIWGGHGDDRIFGGLLSDQILGGEGADIIRGDRAADNLFGETGNDNILGNGGPDYLDGGDGRDRLVGGPGDDFLFGGPGVDQLSGTNGNDELRGGDSNDKLFGELGNDILSGGLGRDELTGGDGEDIFAVQGGDFGIEDIEDFLLGVDKLSLNDTASTDGSPIAHFSDIDTNGNGVLDRGDDDVIEAVGNTILKILFENNEQVWLAGVVGSTVTENDIIISA